MLEINQISLSYRHKENLQYIIKNFSLSVEEGEVLVILGPSGCGKSTLLKTLSGNHGLDSGKIFFDAKNKKERNLLSPNVHKIGFIPQNCGLLPWKNVEKNCLLPLQIRKETITDQRLEQIQDIYRKLNIKDILFKYPGKLSGGQVQRAAIARAFIYQPDILLMDEPFSSLDAITREEAEGLFLKIWKENPIITLLVTHNIEEALYLGQRILVMGNRDGEIRYEFRNPYFGEMFPKENDYQIQRELLRKMLRNRTDRS